MSEIGLIFPKGVRKERVEIGDLCGLVTESAEPCLVDNVVHALTNIIMNN